MSASIEQVIASLPPGHARAIQEHFEGEWQRALHVCADTSDTVAVYRAQGACKQLEQVVMLFKQERKPSIKRAVSRREV